ncbi:unnamed protein product [marine sediment metagenome]|uniref:Uncharacterized protein n=1 Tax=marine sediment metagenome TaxID=412755 RepID=X1U633_9ZZZZ
MKYKVLVTDIVDDVIDLPDCTLVASITPNFRTNKWMIIYLAPVVEEPAKEEPKVKEAEEKSGP